MGERKDRHPARVRAKGADWHVTFKACDRRMGRRRRR